MLATISGDLVFDSIALGNLSPNIILLVREETKTFIDLQTFLFKLSFKGQFFT